MRQARLSMLLLCLGLLVAGLLAAAQPARAQTQILNAAGVGTQKVPADSADAQAILDRARAAGATIIVIDPPQAAAAPAAGTLSGFQAVALEVRGRALALLADAPNLPDEVDRALERSGGLSTVALALAVLLGALAVGGLADWLIGRWAAPQMAFLFHRVPVSRAERIGYLLTRAGIGMVRIAVRALVAGGLVFAVEPATPLVREVALSGILLFAIGGMADIFFRNLLATDLPDHRLPTLSGDAARALYRDIRILLWLALTLVWLAKAGVPLGLPPAAGLLLMSAAALVTALACIWLTLRHRATVGRVLLGSGERPSPMRRAVARLWYVPAVLYFLFAFFATNARLLLGSQQPLQLVTLPILATFGAIALWGILLVLADLAFRQGRPPGANPPGGTLPAGGEGAAPPPRDSSYARLAERATGWLAALAGLALLMHGWELNRALFGSFWGAFWEIVLVVFLAWLAYEGVRIAVDRRIAEEVGGAAGEVPQDEEGPRRGLSRLGTLLPMFRTFLLLAILVFAGMVILSALGVNVTPLFAGAGVIGLAIGFGAQTLIRDIFSGAFFLIDDAFRVGEYVNVGPVKGTVERVSIRSMQLRHQLGPLHTIPFGEIKHLENYSRDWVVMKLPLRLTYDTDVEEVRKLIKNLGQELLEHPEVGTKFLQPLKSQGVFQMEDSAMIIRVKFMTRPGDQFQVRKIVYSRIRELFAQAGIRFAHRQVTVRVADDRDQDDADRTAARPLSPALKQAAAGAALAALAAETPLDGQGGAGDGR